jgi:hypothetical protein
MAEKRLLKDQTGFNLVDLIKEAVETLMAMQENQ